MKLLRWVLCHSLSITLLVSFVLAFSFRDVLKEDLSRLVGKSSQSVEIEKISVNQAEVAEETALTAVTEPTESSPEVKQEVTAEPVAPQVTASNVDNSYAQTFQPNIPDSRSTSLPNESSSDPWGNILTETDDESKLVVTSVEVESGLEASAPNFPPENYDPEESVVETAAIENTGDSKTDNSVMFETKPEPSAQSNSLSNKVRLSSAGESSAATSEYFQVLEEVRQLQWNGKSGPAQAAYEKLMFEYPDQPEAAAELGNIFLQQGNRKAASWAYQNAIPRYLNLHREQEAINLMRFVSQYDPAIAESLQKKYW